MSVLDVSQKLQSSNITLANWGAFTRWGAQQITITKAGTIDSMDFMFAKTGSPSGNFTCAIYSDLASDPNVAISNVVAKAASTLTASMVFYNFVFSTKPTVAVGDKVWIVINATGGDGTNWVLAGRQTTDTYPAGIMKWAVSFGSWTDGGGQAYTFNEYCNPKATMFMLF